MISHSIVTLLVVGGFVAGFVDSIAGGGGLISLPLQILAVGAGALAIGTNKIAGALGALVALLVYMRSGHVQWRRSFSYVILVGIGSWIGTWVSPFLPPQTFRWLLTATCPVILWVVWRKDLWVAQKIEGKTGGPVARFLNRFEVPFLFSGLACGFYDGAWGPGAGTFMFLSLLFIAKMPVLSAVATAKLANFTSAGVALVSYSLKGYVAWLPGSLLAVGMIGGAFVGARYANRDASKVIRPVLVVVVILLMIKLLTQG